MKPGVGIAERTAPWSKLRARFGIALQNPRVLAAILFIATLFVFRNVRHFDFINFDDPEYVTGNPQVRGGLTMDGIVWAFTTTHASNWHPVTWLSHMVDSTLFGAGPTGPHVVNLFLHAANSVLLFLLLRRIMRRQWASLWVAAIFALHPLRVESVAWVSERKDVLSTFFWLLSLIAYARYAKCKQESESSTLGPRPSTYFFWALGAYALGLMSKPMLVTGPFLLLLLDYWPLGRFAPGGARSEEGSMNLTLASLIREKLPFFGLSAVCAVLTFIAQHHAGAVVAMEKLSVAARLENMVVAYARYLGKFLWPVNLAVPYPLVSDWPVSTVLLAFLVILSLSVLTIWLRGRRPYLFTGWFWFLGTLLPVIGLVQVGNQAMADRYTYFPAIGLSIALVWTLLDLRLGSCRCWIAGCAATLSVAAFVWKTDSQLGYWRNNETLFRHSIAMTKGNYLAYDNLGFQLYQTGRVPEAMQCYQKALQLRPGDPNTLNNVGSALLGMGDETGAVKAYESALKFQPNSSDAHNNLGIALAHLNKSTEAERHYREALKLDANNSEAHNNLANLLAGRGNFDEAIFHYRAAIKLNPFLTQALNNLGYILEQQGQYRAAIETFLKALRVKPDDAMLHSNFADVLAKAGKNLTAKKSAVEEYEAALRLSPNLADAHSGLGILLASMGETNTAREHLLRAVELNPADADAKKALTSLEKPKPYQASPAP